ncbi:hypothetical protein M8Z33_39080 [Streptomyces sp. ZAF1911]|uniref:hypothetical protein n=1 Tax=unclassified Streptomyces TaxID=2593676 RepID=UPI00237B8AF6|nr:hypothetical protein [Streptomyces sp. ZAF1911]MDD9382543.1 hypothetical protein [Streptomyces sp. ZAF1911]
MHGPGTPPPHGHQPSTGGVVALRVLFALLPVLSCGLLAWGTMLRLALVTRKPRDWWLLGASVGAEFVWVLLSGLDPTPDNSGWQANTGAACTILTGLGVTVYFLAADIRHHAARRQGMPTAWYPAPPAPYVPPQQQSSAPAYGYPPAAQPAPQRAPEPAPAPTPPPRIGQVRAELDELSELLRKQQPPHNEDPRP